MGNRMSRRGLITITALGLIGTAIPSFASEPKDTRCSELRVYFANEGKLDALHSRFRDHTTRLFEKHGITVNAR